MRKNITQSGLLKKDFPLLTPLGIKKHDIVNRKVCYAADTPYLSGIAQDESFINSVVLVFYQTVERTVYGIILSRLNFQGKCPQTVEVIDKEIYLSVLLIVIIEKTMPVRGKFLRYDRFIDTS